MRSEESFSQSVKYYILKEGVYHAVRSKGSVLKVFKSKKKELARYIKQQKLDFRHAPEEAIVSVVREYERLTDKSTDELIVDRGQLTNELTVHTDTNRLSIVHHPLPTNNTVDLDIRQATLNIVFDAIERQTGCPVYRQPLETDSLVVSIHCEKGDALTALRRVLAGSPFQVSAYGGAFFVLKDNALMTSLPEDFFFREKRKEGKPMRNGLVFP